MSRYVATFGKRQTIVYASSLAGAKEKACAYFHLPDYKVDQVEVRLESKY